MSSRQRDGLRKGGWWYLLPIACVVPGEAGALPHGGYARGYSVVRATTRLLYSIGLIGLMTWFASVAEACCASPRQSRDILDSFSKKARWKDELLVKSRRKHVEDGCCDDGGEHDPGALLYPEEQATMALATRTVASGLRHLRPAPKFDWLANFSSSVAGPQTRPLSMAVARMASGRIDVHVLRTRFSHASVAGKEYPFMRRTGHPSFPLWRAQKPTSSTARPHDEVSSTSPRFILQVAILRGQLSTLRMPYLLGDVYIHLSA